ncbi:hypothetical protein ACHAP3_006100 [Botrytis cinerea]
MVDKAQDEAEKAALNPSPEEGAVPKEKVVERRGMPGIWKSGRNCVSYFASLSIFTITTLLMIPGLAFACYHQRALQLLTLTTISTAPALTYHILPSLNSTFIPPLPGYDASGPIMTINGLFQNYAYPAFASYVAAIFLLIIFASFFNLWFGATATPHKKILMLVLSIFTGCFATLAALQTYLCYQTVYVLNQIMKYSKSTLKISVTPGFLYLIIIHLFWIILLFNVLIIPITTCTKRRRAKRQLQALEADAQELKEKETLGGDTNVRSSPAKSADSDSSDDDHDMSPRGVPPYGMSAYPHPGMQNEGYYGHGYDMPMPMQPQSGERKNKGKREQGRDSERRQLRESDV